MNTAKTIGRNLTMLMYDHDRMKDCELAEKTGVSPSMIGHIKAGNKLPSIALLDKIAEVFGKTGTELMKEEKTP